MILLPGDSYHSTSSTVSVSSTVTEKNRSSSVNKQLRAQSQLPPPSSSSSSRGGSQRIKRTSSSSSCSSSSTRLIRTASTRSVESLSRRRKRSVPPPPPPIKSVRFNESLNQHYEDKRRAWDQCHSTWYSPEDYDQFRMGIREVLERVMKTSVIVNSNPEPETSTKYSRSRRIGTSGNIRKKLFCLNNKNNKKGMASSKDKDDGTSQRPQRKRVLSIYKQRMRTLVDITTDIGFVLDDATHLLDEPLEQMLTQLYTTENDNDSEECCWIGLEVYLFPLLGNESTQRRLSIQGAVQEIQVEYLQHGLWSSATVGSELRDSTRNYSQALTLLAQLLARAVYHSAYHQQL